ncbi:MAG TPA: aspartyl protease family protein [Steroidobacteraceae bacterium]|jgi:tetratricopeptide (TPR) repeat protein
MRLLRAAALLAGVASLSIAPTTTAWAACKVGQLLQLPVTMRGLRALVSAKINGAEIQLAVDSGAFYSVLTPGSAAALHLRLSNVPTGFYMQAIGGSVAPQLTTVKQFTLGGFPVKDVVFLVGGSEIDRDAVGVMGQNVLNMADADYDFGNGRLRLLQAIDCPKTNLAYWAKGQDVSIIELDRHERSTATTGAAYVNGVKISVQFDSGSPESMISVRAARRAGVATDGPEVRNVGSIGGFGRHFVQSWIAPFQSFRIGSEEVRNTRLRIADIDIENIDMLIGADFFLSHHLLVANSQHLLYITYNGGPVFKLPAPQSTAEPQLTAEPAAATTAESQAAADAEPGVDAATYARRGEAESARHDYEHAIADLTHACQLDPYKSEYFLARSTAYSYNKQGELALADLEHSISLNGNNVDALVRRAQLRRAQGDAAGAVADLDTIDRIVPKEADLRLSLGELFGALDRIDSAISQLDQWVPAHSEDAKLPRALNDRCWSRMLGNRDLDKALDDCQRAVRLSPNYAAVLNSRAWVRLRLGQPDKALTDFNAAIILVPTEAWSLYGRGVAEIRKGSTEAGRADIAAALALRPGLEQEAKKYGLSI